MRFERPEIKALKDDFLNLIKKHKILEIDRDYSFGHLVFVLKDCGLLFRLDRKLGTLFYKELNWDEAHSVFENEDI